MTSNPSLRKHPLVDDWLAIDARQRVTVRTGKVEIGQRITTAIALVAARELDVGFDRIDVAVTATERSPDEGYTSGSNSMEESGEAVRLAAATARRHLLGLAAKRLEVDPESLEVSDGLVRSRDTNRSTTYWDLLAEQDFGIEVDPGVAVKSASKSQKRGHEIKPLGIVDLVGGTARFVQDMQVPGMLHARVVRPPHYHARLEHLGDGIIERIHPALLVRDGSFLAVAAEDEYLAVQAASKLAAAARWSADRLLEPGPVSHALVTKPRVSLPVYDGIPRDQPVPSPAPAPEHAVATLEAWFERPYQMHASIGPSAALAVQEADRLTIHTHSQGIYPLRETIAQALGMPESAVQLTHVPGPGCYGHNGADDAAFDAAIVARAIPQTPILLKWMRADEHAWEPYTPCMAVHLRASLDDTGQVVQWSHDSYSDSHIRRPRPGPDRAGPALLLASAHRDDSIEPPAPRPNMGPHSGIHRNADPLYTFARRRIVKHLVRGLPLRTSAMRALGAFANVFAIESFMDELALAAGSDPVEFRLRHLEDSRARAVIEAAAARIGWRGGRSQPGIGTGLGFARYKNAKAYAAVGVAVEVDEQARIRLRHAVVAADAGQVVDHDGLASQLEGGFLQAASWTLCEEVTFDETGVTSTDWESYPILGFDNVPEIDTVLMDRPGERFLGAGEAACGPTAAAITNAVFDAIGVRLRKLPFKPEAVRAAALE